MGTKLSDTALEVRASNLYEVTGPLGYNLRAVSVEPYLRANLLCTKTVRHHSNKVELYNLSHDSFGNQTM